MPILLLTSLDAASDRYWGGHVGADQYLTKDFEAPELVAAVRGLIEAAAKARGGRPALRPDPLELTEHAPGRFTLATGPGLAGFGHVMVGLLRAHA